MQRVSVWKTLLNRARSEWSGLCVIFRSRHVRAGSVSDIRATFENLNTNANQSSSSSSLTRSDCANVHDISVQTFQVWFNEPFGIFQQKNVIFENKFSIVWVDFKPFASRDICEEKKSGVFCFLLSDPGGLAVTRIWPVRLWTVHHEPAQPTPPKNTAKTCSTTQVSFSIVQSCISAELNNKIWLFS